MKKCDLLLKLSKDYREALIELTTKWSWNDTNGSLWDNELFDTKQEAVRSGESESDSNAFFIGQCKLVNPVGVDIDDILENVSLNTTEEMCDGVGEDYLADVDKLHKKELENEINKVLFNWMKEYNYEPDFYTIEKIEKMKLGG